MVQSFLLVCTILSAAICTFAQPATTPPEPTTAVTQDGGTEETVPPPTFTFLPYGRSGGDRTVQADVNLMISLGLSVPLHLYNKNLSNLFIAPNGLISPSGALSDFEFAEFPRDSSPVIPLIVPLWANFEPLTINYRVTEDSATLQQVTHMIAYRNPELRDYQPSLAVVVTVEDAQMPFRNIRVTYQTILSTDGVASFAAFIYDDPTTVADITGDVQVGFDAGDEIRGVNLFGTRGSTISNLEQVNIFRIDGNCVTGIGRDEVCGLDSMSTGCSSNDSLTTVDCLCNPGVNTSDGCQSSVEFTCPEGSEPFPQCTEISPVCISSDKVCNRIADCDGAADEVPSLCGSNITFMTYGPGINDAETSFDEGLHYYDLKFTNIPIVFYRQKLEHVYVSSNGLVTFMYDLLSNRVQSVPRDSYPLIPVVAPLWTMFIPQTLGSIFRRITYSHFDLDSVKKVILQQNPDLTDYQPSVAIIVTWHNFMLPNEQPITYQAIVSSDGTASFATFVYDDDGLNVIKDFEADKLVGFDASDTIRSATVLSPGFSSLPSLERTNTFRIDGHCITTAYPGEVCGLNSYAVGCDVNGLSATACRCYETVDLEALNGTANYCEANATFICEEGSVPSICPEGGDDSPFLGCFPNAFLCNLASDCPGGIDEDNCTKNAFLSFGEGEGDNVANGDDENIAVFSLDVPLVFYQQQQTQLYVSVNGFISFQDEILSRFSYLTDPFPTGRVTPMIAPLWVDFQFTVSGAIYSRETSDPDTLNQVVEMIANLNPALSGYRPTLAVVVTWFEPRLHSETSGPAATPVVGTFQAILSTDGSATFAVFIYKDLELISTIPFHQVGFNSGDDSKFVNIVGSSLPPITGTYTGNLLNISAFRIDGACVTSVLPGEVCGLGAVATECPESSLAATTCVCGAGFEYQGATCMDIDECDIIADLCDVNAECNNTEGSFECICKEGYTGDGSLCSALSVPDDTTAITVGVVLTLTLAAVFAVTVAIVVVMALRFRKREMKKRRRIQAKLDWARSSSQTEKGSEYFHRLMSVSSQLSLDVPKTLLVNSCNLQLGKTIGQGEFGIVYKALLKRGFNETHSKTVAVKTLKGFLNEKLVDDLLKECTKMQEFDHPNVLKLLGVCLDGGPAPYIIMPFMNNGSLLSHLKENRETLVVHPNTLDLDQAHEVQKKLLDVCIQVAKGMEYLASKRVIHRDLAARNCMIDPNFVIKVADFGLSESIDVNKNYFRMNQDNVIKLPIKWLSIESINEGIFSEKTDIWAFGVTCWEIFSGGKTPYPGIHPLELYKQLDAGYRMEKPPNAACSDEVYSIINDCWNKDPELRPIFSDLVNKLVASLGTMADYFCLSPVKTPGHGSEMRLPSLDSEVFT